MRRSLHEWLSPARVIALGVMMAAGCMLFHSGPTLFAEIAGIRIPTQKLSMGHWRLDSESVPPGVYYLSLGRPRGLCDLSLDDRVVDSTRGAVSGLRGEFLLGTPLRIQEGVASPLIRIDCEDEQGFPPLLSHAPVVASPRVGVLIQLARAIWELVVGPVACLLLILGLALFSFTTSRDSRSGIRGAHWLFAAVSTIYAFSLAYYTRLLMDGLSASILHLVLRFSWSLSFALLCGTSRRISRVLVFSHVGVMLFLGWVGLTHPDLLNSAYIWSYLLIPVSAALIAWDLFEREVDTDTEILLRPMAVCYGLLALMDTSIMYLGFGIFSAPTTLAVMAIGTLVLRVLDQYRLNHLVGVSSRITEIFSSRQSPREQLVSLAEAIHQEFSFSRITAYMDAHVAGGHDRPGEVFSRMLERGYEKATHQDGLVDFREERGVHMRQALRGNRIHMGRGARDQVWFLNVPLGTHACLNLSDTRPRVRSVVNEGMQTLERLLPMFNVLGERLAEQGARQGMALERLRSIYGDGEFNVELGAVFADINGYSRLAEQHGAAFTRFIGSVYLPSLCIHLRPWASREFSKGDELYLVCLKELATESAAVPRLTMSTVAEVLRFAAGPGQRLCREAGFPVVTFSVAANIGQAVLICDPFQVRTSGEVIIHAARLREVAPKGGALLHPNLLPHLTDEERKEIGAATPILVKKTALLAHPFLPRIAA